MQGGAIAFMPREFVTGMPRLHLHHDAVARDLGDDARRRDAETPPVPTHQRRLLDRKRPHRPAVDQRVVRRQRQRGDGPAHRLMGGAIIALEP